MGLARTSLPSEPPFRPILELLRRLQHEVHIAQAELASPVDPPKVRIQRRHVDRLERDIDASASALTPQHAFALADGARGGAQIHVARTVARRAERELWALDRVEPLEPTLLVWLNRLSDLLFALALEVNRLEGVPAVPPDYTV